MANSGLTYLELDAPASLRAMLEGSYLLSVLLEGRAEIRMGKSDLQLSAGEGAVFEPGRAFELDTAGRACILMFRVDKAMFERQTMLLTEKILSDGIQFESHVRLDSGKGPSLLRALRFVASELQDDSGVAHTRTVQDNLEQMLIRALLETQPSEISPLLGMRDSPVVPRCVLRVERYIAEHLAGEISVDEMIAASGVSGRTMFSAFKKFRGHSPMAHVRHLRMQQVRRDLIEAPPGTRVTDILTKRGITQFGRFAVIYKKMFGESPSQTIKRGRTF
jgi:AraC-like DNA-binding protein